MERACLECGEKVIGRSDKKFCSDVCRNAFNNALNRDSKKLIRNTHNRLRKNYRILEGLVAEGKTKVAHATLLQLGFSFHYVTEVQLIKKSLDCRYVYDHGYIPLEKNTYRLVKKEAGSS